MTDDPYASLDETPEFSENAPQPAPRSRPEPVVRSGQTSAQEPLGYSYPDANTDYAYGPPPQQPYAPQQGAYGVPFYGQPQNQYLAVPATYLHRPLIDDPTADDAPLPGASALEAYKRFWMRGLTFTGRASRSEYWWPALFHGVGFILWMVMADSSNSDAMFAIGGLAFLASLLPALALGIRRLHDTDNSGWLHLLSCIPYLGALAQVFLMAQPSKPNGMRYDKVNQR